MTGLIGDKWIYFFLSYLYVYSKICSCPWFTLLQVTPHYCWYILSDWYFTNQIFLTMKLPQVSKMFYESKQADASLQPYICLINFPCSWFAPFSKTSKSLVEGPRCSIVFCKCLSENRWYSAAECLFAKRLGFPTEWHKIASSMKKHFIQYFLEVVHIALYKVCH